MSRLSSNLSAFPNKRMNWKRLANCHIFLMRWSTDGSLGGCALLLVSPSWRARLRDVGIVTIGINYESMGTVILLVSWSRRRKRGVVSMTKQRPTRRLTISNRPEEPPLERNLKPEQSECECSVDLTDDESVAWTKRTAGDSCGGGLGDGCL